MNKLSTMPCSTVQIEARNLTLAYGRTTIIHQVSLAIPPGQITVLVGANGCGKSTLLKGLGRLLKPCTGQVYLNNKPLASQSTKAIARHIALLSQNPVAPEGLTVRELVAQGRYPHQTWLQQWSIQDEQAVDDALQITDLEDLCDRPLDTLSGGQRQRAWIAMVLAQDTDILLLDEPTTFLDLAHQVEVLDLLYDLYQSQGRTIVLVLHDLNQACRYGHHVVAIKEGKIYAQGAPSVVMTATMVQDVFGLKSKIIADPVAGTPMCIPIARSL
ncbi:ABC transporter ATP-binding protein [Leptolyngbya sp. CCY15150]|uniref:ABC transporter ATP-binding protein n=1 Tax=Leptolyngbya sp. CCY15150 TaxID=2767772 RepID=UPI001EF3A372|nr:ABC transporter ATP-binding protein [Leptolyngbya sp. CCY15150]